MFAKKIATMVLGASVLLLSHVAIGWTNGPCTSSGSAPCIETEVSGNSYHINGTAGGAGVWYGLPTTGEDFEFTGPWEWNCSGLNLNCTWTLRGKVKKCQDSNGDWRIGLQINSADVFGNFPCVTIEMGGFPWYANSESNSAHCPFVDDCDALVLYDQSSPSLTFNIGNIGMSVLSIPRITDGHMHDMVFVSGAGAHLSFDSDVLDCMENSQNCHFTGSSNLTNAASLYFF